MSKKATKNTKDFRQYAVGDPVLGKVRGYPPWPGVVVDPNEVPQPVLSEQPGGKKSIFHCVLFFPMGDYAWLHPKDLSTLKRHEIEAFLADEAKKRNGDLREGYSIALDPHEWMEKYQKSRAAATQKEDEEDEVDELESEKDGGAGSTSSTKKAKPTKKRKRDSEEAAAKPKKTPKPKKEAAEPKKKAPTKSKKNGAKSKAMVESEDEGDNAEAEGEDDDSGPSKKTSPPPAKKAKRDKDDDGDDAKNPGDPQSIKVRDWRHKLQKTFLSSKTLPKAEAMQEIDQLFTTVETYNEMTIEQLQFSKIGKVMRHIAALPIDKIPRDDEYNFRTRAKDLVDRWHQILNTNKPTNGSPTVSAVGAAHTNGNGKAEEKVDEDVMQRTKNLDLNGETEASPSADIDAPADDAGDTSVLADVTMSEA